MLFPPLPLGHRVGLRVVRAATRLAPSGPVAGATVASVGLGAFGIRLHRPKSGSGGALLWIHGGGLVIGTGAQDDRFCSIIARDLGAVVVSVDYRLAPEHPFPVALDDCAEAWEWVLRSAGDLGVDPRRVAVGGQSAGGGLAASLAQRIHDTGGVQPVAQWLFCPMLDDRTAGRRELDQEGHRVWNNRLNRIGWRAYLGTEPGTPGIPAYAVAARRTDLRGLPPAWIGVGDIDLFADEDRDYADRLAAAGVPCTLDVVPGAPHGFEAWATGTRIAQGFLDRARTWLDSALTAPTT